MPFSLRAVGGVRFVQRRQGLQRFAAPHSRCLDSSSILLCFDRSVEVTSSLHPRTGSIPRDGTVYRGHATKATFFFGFVSCTIVYTSIIPSTLSRLSSRSFSHQTILAIFFLSFFLCRLRCWRQRHSHSLSLSLSSIPSFLSVSYSN